MRFSDLAEDIHTLAIKYNQEVTAVLFYEEARRLFHRLSMYEDLSIVGFELNEPRHSFYEHEYYIEINPYGDLAVEPAKINGVYVDPECDIMFIDGNASCALLQFAPIGCTIELNIENNEIEYVCDCDDCDDSFNTFDVSIVIKEADKDEFISDYEYYDELFDAISLALCLSDYTVDDNGKVTKVKLDATPIFDCFR